MKISEHGDGDLGHLDAKDFFSENQSFDIRYARDAGCSGFVIETNDAVDVGFEWVDLAGNTICCPACKSKQVYRFGYFNTKNGKTRRYRCWICKKTFHSITKNIGGVFLPIKTRLKNSDAVRVLHHLVSGDSITATARLTGRHFATVMRIARELKKHINLKCSCGEKLGRVHWCKWVLQNSTSRRNYLEANKPSRSRVTPPDSCHARLAQ